MAFFMEASAALLAKAPPARLVSADTPIPTGPPAIPSSPLAAPPAPAAAPPALAAAPNPPKADAGLKAAGLKPEKGLENIYFSS
jgi:2-oxoglutarate dehydrogenase E2 component (dihydrolipoamide succinyltransferase)